MSLVDRDKSKSSWRSHLLLAAGLAGLLVLGGLLFVVTRGSEHDPRAYPHSQSQSLTDELHRYRLELPKCAEGSVRYLRYTQGLLDSFYLHFRGDRQCINEFLTNNGMDRGETWQQHGLPFSWHVPADFGWPQDPDRKYLSTTHWIGSVHVEVAIDFSASPFGLYLHAGII